MLGLRHLRVRVREFAEHYNHERPHSGGALATTNGHPRDRPHREVRYLSVMDRQDRDHPNELVTRKPSDTSVPQGAEPSASLRAAEHGVYA